MLNANAESPNVRPEQARSSWVQKALQKCGDFSYSLYAVHMPIVVLINFVLFDGLKKEGILLAVLPALAATLLVSYLVYRCVEVPSIRMLKRLPR
jgi:peptidoglycan/LPS O-acetylase OafA/YrhL